MSWISVEDKVPPEGESVLVYGYDETTDDEEERMVTWLDSYTTYDGWECCTTAVTHWMHLPLPPGQPKEKAAMPPTALSQEHVLSLAREAGFTDTQTRLGMIVTRHTNGSWVLIEPQLLSFAELVAESIRRSQHQPIDETQLEAGLQDIGITAWGPRGEDFEAGVRFAERAHGIGDEK